ncbi:transposable element Tcb1 transposase [Trichonephila clavipes]|nr:transposable element Tcb1 transposase [Trichonephila clavipes]
MIGHIYWNVILKQHVRLFRGFMSTEFLFMDDNARPHRANIVDECLHSEDITRMHWPAYSPDLNPIYKKEQAHHSQQVANQFLAASGKQISRKTVARRLKGGGLYARRPVVCVPLTRQHRTARLQWCREHHNWTEKDWACVLFSDESRFSLSSDCRRQLIWRESGTACRPENIQENDRYPTCSIMV